MLTGKEGAPVSRRDQEEWCLVGVFSGREGDGVAGTPGGVCFAPGVGSILKEGVFVWKEGIGNKSFEFCA